MTGFEIWCDGNCLHEETGFDIEDISDMYDDAKDYCESIIERQNSGPMLLSVKLNTRTAIEPIW